MAPLISPTKKGQEPSGSCPWLWWFYLGNSYQKIGAHNRAEATAYAFRQGIAPAWKMGSA